MTRFCLVLVTAPAGAIARRISEHLLKRRLAACVNLLPTVASRYWWKGQLESARESLLLVKTRRSYLPRVIRAVRAVHPYDVPEIIAVPITSGNAAYLRWLRLETERSE